MLAFCHSQLFRLYAPESPFPEEILPVTLLSGLLFSLQHDAILGPQHPVVYLTAICKHGESASNLVLHELLLSHQSSST